MAVTFEEVLTQAMAMLQRLGRVSYRALKVQFQLDDDLLALLKDEIVEVHRLARDQAHTPLTYTPPHLAEKILTSRSAIEGERKQVARR